MEIVSAKSLNLNDLTNMQVALESNKHLKLAIDETARSYHTIDVYDAMKNLENVGQILRLAYAGSKSFSCSTSTTKILINYQRMIKNSSSTLSSFVEACLSALKSYKLALKMVEKDKLDVSLKWIEKCSEEAKTMAEECGKLVLEATDLSNLSGDALIDAHKDESISHSERERIKQMIVESRAKQAEMDVKTKQLHEQIAEARQKQAEISDKADTERLRVFCLKVITSSLVPVNSVVEASASVISMASSAANAAKLAVKSAEAGLNVLNKQLAKNAESPDSSSATEDEKNDHQSSTLSALVEQENLIIKLKNDLQKEEREANAEIARIGELLKGLSKQGDDLSASILSLELAIAALGKVRTTFENTRLFWLGVEKQCKKLTKIENLRLNSDPSLKEEFIDELNNIGLSWLTLGKINYFALLVIQKVDQKSDSIMNNLPTKQEALEIVQKDADMILKSLTE